MGLIDKLFNQYIGRVVAFVLMPLLTTASISVVPWINQVLGTDLTAKQVATATFGVILGQILLGWQWLKNRGHWEVATKIQDELFDAYHTGTDNVAVNPVVDAPPVPVAPEPNGPVK